MSAFERFVGLWRAAGFLPEAMLLEAWGDSAAEVRAVLDAGVRWGEVAVRQGRFGSEYGLIDPDTLRVDPPTHLFLCCPDHAEELLAQGRGLPPLEVHEFFSPEAEVEATVLDFEAGRRRRATRGR